MALTDSFHLFFFSVCAAYVFMFKHYYLRLCRFVPLAVKWEPHWVAFSKAALTSITTHVQCSQVSGF